MNSFNNKLNLFFVSLCLTCCVALFAATASLSTDVPGKRVKYLQFGMFGKLANAEVLVPKVQIGSGKVKEVENLVHPEEKIGSEKVKAAYDAFDFTSKVTDQMDDCSSELCTKVLNHPDHLPRCAGCAVKTVTHPLDALNDSGLHRLSIPKALMMVPLLDLVISMFGLLVSVTRISRPPACLPV